MAVEKPELEVGTGGGSGCWQPIIAMNKRIRPEMFERDMERENKKNKASLHLPYSFLSFSFGRWRRNMSGFSAGIAGGNYTRIILDGIVYGLSCGA